jgi:hypothetical protein
MEILVKLYKAKDNAPPLTHQQKTNYPQFYTYNPKGDPLLLFNPPTSSDSESDSSYSDMDDDNDDYQYEAGNSDDDPNLLS